MSKVLEPGTVFWKNYLLGDLFSVLDRKGCARIFGCYFCGVSKVEKRTVDKRVCPSCARPMEVILLVSLPPKMTP